MSDQLDKTVKKEAANKGVPSAIRDRLVEGEHVVKMAHIHIAIFWQAFAVAVIALLFGIFIAPELCLFLLLVAALMAGYAYVRRSILLCAVTNKRVLARYGILQVDVVDVHFDKIESIELERMPTAYLMGYSSVVVMGTGQRYISIPYVENGPELRRAYNEIVLADKS